MKAIFVSIGLITFCTLTGFAQFEDANTSSEKAPSNSRNAPVKTPLKDKIVVGGGLDLQFGDITAIGLTPLVAYAATDKLLVGSIFTYRYFKDNRFASDYTTHTYGVSPFARYFIYQGFFAHVEYELLYGEFSYNQGSVWVDSFLVGGGYGQRIGKNGFVGIYVLWNLSEDPNYAIYNNPIFRLSFGVGL